MQLRLVIDAVEPQPARKIDQRLLLRHAAQHLRRGLQGSELAIGVEDVEFRIVLPECRSGIGTAGVIRFVGGVLPLADNHGLQNAQQPVAIGRKVLQHVHRSAVVAHDRDQVGGSHLAADELLGCKEGAKLIRWPHRRHVEIKNQQAAVPITFVLGIFRGNLGPGQLPVDLEGFPRTASTSATVSCIVNQVLVFAKLDRLRLCRPRSR